jgi:hypothetical protein
VGAGGGSKPPPAVIRVHRSSCRQCTGLIVAGQCPPPSPEAGCHGLPSYKGRNTGCRLSWILKCHPTGLPGGTLAPRTRRRSTRGDPCTSTRHRRGAGARPRFISTTWPAERGPDLAGGVAATHANSHLRAVSRSRQHPSPPPGGSRHSGSPLGGESATGASEGTRQP